MGVFRYTLDEIRSTYTFDVSCKGSVPQAIRAFLEGSSFTDVLSGAISIGGDSDTIAAIAGSIAEVIYPVPQGLRGRVIDRMDRFLLNTIVETVVLLSKGEIDSKKVRVEFSLEDMDMSGFQKGATYEQIKAYVLEHTGLKVSSLYISQIKRKCGLDVGQNYNLSKKEDAKVPKCPPEKEAAIRDALKYFQMI